MARPINNNRKLTRIGRSSLGLILPAEMLRDLKWRERQRLNVKRVPRGIMITDAASKKSN